MARMDPFSCRTLTAFVTLAPVELEELQERRRSGEGPPSLMERAALETSGKYLWVARPFALFPSPHPPTNRVIRTDFGGKRGLGVKNSGCFSLGVFREW